MRIKMNNMLKLSKISENFNKVPNVFLQPEIKENLLKEGTLKKLPQSKTEKEGKIPAQDILEKIESRRNIMKNKFSTSNYYRGPEIPVDPTPDPGKYNPNYKAIYRKVPYAIIKKKSSHSKFSSLPKVNIYHEPPPETYDRWGKNELNSESSRNFRLQLENNDSVLQTKSRRKEKAINFSLYTPRKDIMQNPNTSTIVSYLDPEKITTNERKQLHALNFSKMRTRNFEDFINNKAVPAVCTYNPNFEAVSASKKLLMPYKQEEIYKKNKLLVQKMWRSYHVSMDYKTVKFKSFLDGDLVEKSKFA